MWHLHTRAEIHLTQQDYNAVGSNDFGKGLKVKTQFVSLSDSKKHNDYFMQQVKENEQNIRTLGLNGKTFKVKQGVQLKEDHQQQKKGMLKRIIFSFLRRVFEKIKSWFRKNLPPQNIDNQSQISITPVKFNKLYENKSRFLEHSFIKSIEDQTDNNNINKKK